MREGAPHLLGPSLPAAGRFRPARPWLTSAAEGATPFSLCSLGTGRKRHTAWAGEEGAGGRGPGPLAAQSRVLTAAAPRERGGPGGAAEGVSLQAAGADQPRASAQVSGQWGPGALTPGSQPASWELTVWVCPLPSLPFPSLPPGPGLPQ